MNLKHWIDGEVLYAADLNNEIDEALNNTGMNTIRTLQDRTITYSMDKKDGWGDAYSTSGGRMSSVVSGTVWDTNRYKLFQQNPTYVDIYASYVNPGTISDGTNEVYCLKLANGIWRVFCTRGGADEQISRIFQLMFAGLAEGVTTPKGVVGLTELRISDTRYRNKKVVSFQSYHNQAGATSGYLNLALSATDTNAAYVLDDYCWATEATGDSTAYLNGPIATTIHSYSNQTGIDHRNMSSLHTITAGTCDGIRAGGSTSSGTSQAWQVIGIFVFSATLTFTKTTSGTITISTTSGAIAFSATAPDTTTYPIGSGVITHNIPTGTFSATTSSAIGAPLVKEISSGTIHYKLINNTTTLVNDALYGNTNLVTADAGATVSKGWLVNVYISGTKIKTVTKHASCTATRAVVLNSINTVVASASFVGNVATFSPTYVIPPGCKICVDSNGAAYNGIYLTSPGFDFYAVSCYASNGWNGSASTNTSFNIVSLTTEFPAPVESEGTAWLDTNTVTNFTAFTSEPQQLLVKLENASTLTQMTNNGFESAIAGNWTYGENDPTGCFSGGGRVTDWFQEGTASIKIVKSAVISTQNVSYAEYVLTGVNLTGATNIACFCIAAGANPEQRYHQLIVSDGTNEANVVQIAGPTASTKISGVIPVAYRTSGMIVKLRVIDTNNTASASTHWFDYVTISNEEDPSIYGFWIRAA